METISSSYNELILVDDDYFVSLLNDINLAKDNIKMETYIFAYDEIGIKVAEALLDAARRGVTIRLLVDGIGTRNWKTLQKRVNHKRIQ